MQSSSSRNIFFFTTAEKKLLEYLSDEKNDNLTELHKALSKLDKSFLCSKGKEETDKEPTMEMKMKDGMRK